MSTKIEWTDDVWNPVTGCDRVSPGCDNCYAERIAHRFGRPFLGAVELHEDRLDQPFRWRKPRRVFVNSVSDLFHPDVDDLFLAEVFAVMSLTPQHTYQILTKRQKGMHGVLTSDEWWYKVALARRRRGILARAARVLRTEEDAPLVRPLPNVWLGVSVENQRYADLRIPPLIETPAAVRFLSVEPMLGPVDLRPFTGYNSPSDDGAYCPWSPSDQKLGWVIVGGESGPGARPMHVAWARDVRDVCNEAEIPYFFKQWGEWAGSARPGHHSLLIDGTLIEPGVRLGMNHMARPWSIARLGKTKAGRELDGRTWDEYPA